MNSAKKRSPRRTRSPVCRSATARTLPISRSSQSTPKMRATMTMRSGLPRATTATGGTRSSPSPTSVFTSAKGRNSTARRWRAATASISPIAWCRCCPTNCLRTSARSSKVRSAPRSPATSTSARTGRSKAGNSPAPRFALPQTLRMRMHRRRWMSQASKSLKLLPLPARCRRLRVRSRPNWSSRRLNRSGLAGRLYLPRGPDANRSNSIFPSAASCSTKRAGSCRSPHASVWTRIGWSRII